jgi:phage tail-like protein
MPHVASIVSAAISQAKAGARLDPYTGFRFRVQIIGVRSWRAGFSSVEGLEEESEVVEYREGTDRITKKLPGIYKATEIILTRGKSRSNDLQVWRAQVELVQRRGVYPIAFFRRTMKIQLMNDFQLRLKGWTIFECWPSKLSHPTLEATTSDVWMESATIQNEGQLPDPFDLRNI